tara:strand:+ start:164 stop:583 length:420 start_codon:yes stop_codon:yes gene_type:complete
MNDGRPRRILTVRILREYRQYNNHWATLLRQVAPNPLVFCQLALVASKRDNVSTPLLGSNVRALQVECTRVGEVRRNRTIGDASARRAKESEISRPGRWASEKNSALQRKSLPLIPRKDSGSFITHDYVLDIVFAGRVE